MEKRLPKSATERGQLYLYANTPERQEVLGEIRKRNPSAKSLSDAVFQALAVWEAFGEVGQVIDPLVTSLGSIMTTASVYLAQQKDKEFAQAVHKALLMIKLSEFTVTLLEEAPEALVGRLPAAYLKVLKIAAQSMLEDSWKLNDKVKAAVDEVVGLDAVLNGIDNQGDHWGIKSKNKEADG